jgi:hypothetical protein
MSDIFVSYSRADRDRVRPIVEGLEKNGWTVWWDPNIVPGERYAASIDAELKTAKCVLVAWSASSAVSDWVQEEAEDGKTRGVLLPVLIDDIPIPRGFRRIQTVDLSDWNDDLKGSAWAYVIAAAKRFVDGGPAPAIKPPKTRRQRRAMLLANGLSFVLLSLIAVGVFWLIKHPTRAVAVTQNSFISNIVNVFRGVGQPIAATGAESGPAAPAPPFAGKPGGSIEAAASAATGGAVLGAIKSTEETHFYRFEPKGKLRDIAIIRLENRSGTLKPDFKVYNADRSQLFERYDGTPGASVEGSMTMDPGKAIYVEVLAYGSTGDYQLTVTPQRAYDALEPNDDVLTAYALRLGQPAEGNVMDDKDADWFRISGAVGPNVIVSLENLSTTLKPDVKVFSASKSQLLEKYDGTPGANLEFTASVEAGKNFYVQIVPYGSTGKYRLTTRPAP